MARIDPSHVVSGPAPLSAAALSLDDDDLVRELRSWARTLARGNDSVVERNARRLLRLAVITGIPLVRHEFAAPDNRSEPCPWCARRPRDNGLTVPHAKQAGSPSPDEDDTP